ncbi:hypothetical protein ABW20_dc0103500 [Dactylellina cionopaga]|nr:hypothetical protein ABW20_dc0103500 [Dactylellina cionopaga]
MQLDLENLRTARTSWRSNFVDEVLRVQSYAQPVARSQKWANDLRFLTPNANFTGKSDRSDCTCKSYTSAFPLPLKDLDLRIVRAPMCYHYVAISYCWKDRDARSSGRQVRVQGKPAKSDLSDARIEVLERAAAYAKAYGVPFIWVDQECIDQNNREDKEEGIQSMDLVYQRARYPLGVLSKEIDDQNQLDALHAAMSCHHLTTSQLKSLADVLEKITTDIWFSRAWIVQEVVSSGGMTLLIPRKASLKIPKTDPPVFGRTPGEVEIRLDASDFGFKRWHRYLYTAMTWAPWKRKAHKPLPSLKIGSSMGGEKVLTVRPSASTANPNSPRYLQSVAYDGLDEISKGKIKSSLDVLSKILINKEEWEDFGDPDAPVLAKPVLDISTRDRKWRYTQDMDEALKILGNRQCKYVSDRLAILANLCNYQVRVNTAELRKRDFTFSACALAMTIMNNDLSFFEEIHAPFAGLASDLGEFNDIYGDSTVSYKTLHFVNPRKPEEEPGLLFLSLSNNWRIYKGRCWVIDHLLQLTPLQKKLSDLRLIYKKHDPREAERLIGNAFYQSLVEELLKAKMFDLAYRVWDYITEKKPAEPAWSDLCKRVSKFSPKAVPRSPSFFQQLFLVPELLKQVDAFFIKDIYQKESWLIQQVEKHGIVCTASLVTYGCQILRETRAIFNGVRIGSHVFEPILSINEPSPGCWRVHNVVRKWVGNEERERAQGAMFSIHTMANDGYILRRLKIGDRVGFDGYVKTEISQGDDSEGENYDVSEQEALQRNRLHWAEDKKQKPSLVPTIVKK